MIEILKSVPFFAGLPDEDLRKIGETVKMDYFPAGHEVFHEGAQGNLMYILKRGQAQVLRGGIAVATLGDGAFFGEMALVSDMPRNATIKTVTDAEVLTLSKEDFIRLIETNPSIASMVSYEVVKRSNALF